MSRFFAVLAFLFAFSHAEPLSGDGAPYALSPLQNIGQSKESYYDSLGVPNLYVGTQSYKDCKKDCCYSTLENEKGEVLRSFSTSDSVGSVARTRYKDISYLYYSHSFGNGKDRQTTYHLIDNTLRSYEVPNGAPEPFDSLISKERDLVQITPSGLYLNGSLRLQSRDFEAGVLSANLDGDIGAAAIDVNNDSVYVTNMREWKSANITLAQHSDRNNILNLYPLDENRLYVGAYNLINVYNKGLMDAVVDFSKNETHGGWIYNSEKENIGFYPELYAKEGSIVVRAKNSSDETFIFFLITPELYATIDQNTPKREGFEDESMVDFMAGAGVSYLGWSANSEVSKNGNTYASAEYEISNSLYKELYFQGRIGDYQLAISYAQNEAEKKGGLTKKASQLLSAFIDLHGLVSDSSSLRIAYTKGEVNGITTFKDKSYGGTSVTPNGDIQEFTTSLERIGLLNMAEKGLYYGLEYTSFQTPAAVGFSNSSKAIEYYGLDKAMKMQNYEIVIGYDTAAYAKRYESDFESFYLQGMFGIGASIYDLSSDIKERVESLSNKSILSSTYSLVLDAEVDLGYIWQKRFKSVRGIGYSIELGAKVRGICTGIGQSSDSDSSINANELKMEMSRYDIWYGPYNIVF